MLSISLAAICRARVVLGWELGVSCVTFQCIARDLLSERYILMTTSLPLLRVTRPSNADEAAVEEEYRRFGTAAPAAPLLLVGAISDDDGLRQLL